MKRVWTKSIFFFHWSLNGGGWGGRAGKGAKCGKWLQIAGVLLPYNEWYFSLLLLLCEFDSESCPERWPVCQQRGRKTPLARLLWDMWSSINVEQQPPSSVLDSLLRLALSGLHNTDHRHIFKVKSPAGYFLLTSKSILKANISSEIVLQMHLFLRAVDAEVQRRPEGAGSCCSCWSWILSDKILDLVDIEKVYDRVLIEELWYCVRRSVVAEKFVIIVVQDMHKRRETGVL